MRTFLLWCLSPRRTETRSFALSIRFWKGKCCIVALIFCTLQYTIFSFIEWPSTCSPPQPNWLCVCCSLYVQCTLCSTRWPAFESCFVQFFLLACMCSYWNIPLEIQIDCWRLVEIWGWLLRLCVGLVLPLVQSEVLVAQEGCVAELAHERTAGERPPRKVA